MYNIKDFSTPRLFILRFISNKTKYWDESYHNTSIYHITRNIIIVFTANISIHIQKPLSKFHLCQLFTINVYMPTVQFAEVQNKSSLSNNCCVYDIMVI